MFLPFGIVNNAVVNMGEQVSVDLLAALEIHLQMELLGPLVVL